MSHNISFTAGKSTAHYFTREIKSRETLSKILDYIYYICGKKIIWSPAEFVRLPDKEMLSL